MNERTNVMKEINIFKTWLKSSSRQLPFASPAYVRSHHYSIMHRYVNRLIIESQEVTVASSTSTDQSDEPYGTWSVTELNPGDCVTCIIMYVLQGVISFLTAHQYN